MVVNSFENSISDGKKDANIKGFTIRKLSFSEEETATHSSILTGIIPWTEEPDRLQSMGSQRVRHNRVTEHIKKVYSIENRLIDMGRGEERVRCMGRVTLKLTFSSVQFSRSVMSDSLRAHGLQHARPPCPSPTPGVHSNSCPSSR